MNRNTLIAILAICVTINILAGAYVITEFRGQDQPVAAGVNTAVAEPAVSYGEEISTDLFTGKKATEESVDFSRSSPVKKKKSARSTEAEYVIKHLDKYLNFVPSSNAVSPDGFNNIYFTIVNSSDFTFDEVVINFRCFLSDGSLWYEKNYAVGPIAPQSRTEQLLPDQSRGHSIKWQTVSIKSSDLNFSWPE